MKKHGCLVWWTFHTNQPLGIWKLSPSVMPLLPIIQAHVANGTKIHSDQWAAYRQVASLPSVSTYTKVNHSVTFVDPVSSTHTQNIESYWGKAKRKLKNMKGCHASQLPSYLDEFMWRERFGQTKLMPLRTSCCIFVTESVKRYTNAHTMIFQYKRCCSKTL